MPDPIIVEKTRFFLEKYGDRGLIVLRAAYEISKDPRVDHRFGDFNYKYLVQRLNHSGFKYNPINLLRVLEKEYRIIEKSYSSSNQTWWRFIDIDAVQSVLGEIHGASTRDPGLLSLLIKYKSIEPGRIISFLRRLLSKEILSEGERELFKQFVFSDIDKVVNILKDMEKYEDVFVKEIEVLREILNLADRVSSKLERSHHAPSISENNTSVSNDIVDLVENE